MSYAILFESVMSSAGVPVQQLSNLQLTGVSTTTNGLNTDHGVLYGSLTSASGGTYTFSLYQDITKLDLVAQGTSTTTGSTMTISSQNGSNLSGTVNLIQFAQADTSIVAVVCLSIDSDLPMTNLTGLSDCDPINGFSAYHVLALDYLKQFVMTRDKSILWNPTFVDVSQINGGVGGYDFSRVLLSCWTCPEMREASAHYAFYRIAERQGVEDNTFCRRAKDSKSIVRAHLENIEIQFDQYNTRVESKSRSLSTWKIGRA
jgi:hypothetical protein